MGNVTIVQKGQTDKISDGRIGTHNLIEPIGSIETGPPRAAANRGRPDCSCGMHGSGKPAEMRWAGRHHLRLDRHIPLLGARLQGKVRGDGRPSARSLFGAANAERWRSTRRDSLKYPPNVLAGYAGCLMTREANKAAFAKKGRSTIVSDMIEEIGQVFAESLEKHASSL